MQLNKQFLIISSYSKTSVTLSDGTVISESFYIYESSIKLLGNVKNIEDYLNNYNNYTFIKDNIDILVVGCGKVFIKPSLLLRQYFSNLKVGLDWNITTSAYHMYNMTVQDIRNSAGLFLLNI